MDIQSLVPIMIYDDKCYLCGKFAKVVSLFARKKLLIVGHYTDLGIEIKSEIFSDKYDPTKMFWFIDGKIAYGGRAALLPLITTILIGKIRSHTQNDIQASCSAECKTPKAVFLRTKSLFSSSEKILIK
ncbi:MAG TPA: hypothetical protein VLB45_02515 [Nitrosopumilaceae archaeon]|nr:hypothetical protein [Nitrosopumilaceae archaeon]